MQLSEDHRKILIIIEKLRHATREEIRRLAFPDMDKKQQKRTLQRRIEELCKKGCIGAYGGASDRSYALRQEGWEALEIAEGRMPTHYRPSYGPQKPDSSYVKMWQAKGEVKLRAAARGWSVLEKDDGLRAMREYLIADGKRKYGPDYPEHTAMSSEQRVYPDLVLVTHKEPVILIFANPYATPEFWNQKKRIIKTKTKQGEQGIQIQEGRIERYAQINSVIQAVAIVFPKQEEMTKAVIDRTLAAVRFEVVSHDGLAGLFTRLEE